MGSRRAKSDNPAEAGSVSNDLVKRDLARYGFAASDEFVERARDYIELLLLWNRRISLTAVTSPAEILRFHFGESLFAISAAEIRKGRLADFGSGAGFPGAPLAMTMPALATVLIEANARKCAFLSELKRVIRLNNVSIQAGRAEAVGLIEKFDFVTARAVGAYSNLLGWARQRLTTGGAVVLWLGAKDAAEVRRTGGWGWGEPVQIPGSRERFILKGWPVGSLS
jgi:16S rRNA (guanine527-N7)-methyltransferase